MDAARIDSIVPHLISLLPRPSVPAHDDDGSSDSDDDWSAVITAAPDDCLDHIGRLPDNLLSNIVSRLPTTEAARTMVLSTRWRYLWAATPLLVDDAHLRAADGHRVLRAVSRCVAAHPGPVRAVRITRLSFHRQEYALQCLLADLSAKNVQDLILFNRPGPLDMPLPDDILTCASLTRLYLGVWRWRFPGTTASPPAFPNLHEPGLEILPSAGRNVRPCAMLPSVKILAVKVRFGNNMEAKMLPTLLRCFPRLETLHVMSIRSMSPDAVDDMDIWESPASCDCLESHLKTFVHHGYHGLNHEVGFGSYIFKNGKVLNSYGIIYSDRSDASSSSDDEVVEEGPMSGSVGEGSVSSGGTVGKGNAASGRSIVRYISLCPASPCWNFQNAIDMSVKDPFYVLGPVIGRINLV
uniref:Uncharacterized protein n=1 Tax=Avena sativa TaxID=4498 RepID=A0ACD5Z8V5_AVESA